MIRYPCRYLLCAATFLIHIAFGQQAAKPLEFEIASIRPSSPEAHGAPLYFRNLFGDLTAQNRSVRSLIVFAFHIQDRQLSGGPGWIETEHYDIDAKAPRLTSAQEMRGPNSMSDEQREARDEVWRGRLRKLLADRFGLAVHHEMKDLPVLELTVSGDGPGLKRADKIGERVGTNSGRGRLQGFAAPAGTLATELAGILGRAVVDNTGLKGKFDFVLEWTPDSPGIGPETGETALPGDTSGLTLFAALREQLGLRLKAARAPVDVVVIDRVEKPSAN